ncbi:erythromycin biosynthesis sensory transduction protein eryC1 [Saccharothrix sp. NRRL B-16348]|uniref:DegT/DnrJ/EryC1/StrS family aminotransferase n=1 Tax=Saccharothrix sp. NRRL B-16348 TaxID=1415542 RepID=UPI0006AE8A3F|nr:DegT/DnrJ/EryC1/StrS family aminotransferase [Saccharothrix sp. NRRL B-16348]KOX30116.1 erythromycin biosynthesis sensory transduction protein eryC1 [Saccharothrix sp. NRRL B-16348]
MSDPVAFRDLVAEHATIRDEVVAAVTRVVDAGAFVLGPELEAFEREWADYCGTSHAVGVGSGLSAIELILRAHDVGPGDEVVVPAYTFIATWLAVSAVGAVPVPVDVDPGAGNIDPAAVERAIGPRTVAIIAVHLFGTPAPMTQLRHIADRRSLLLVEDAAQAHGAEYRGRKCGSLADAAAFSFYPTKNLGALGDGGVVNTDSATVADRVRSLRNYGSTTRYRHDETATNSRLDEIQAAVLRVKLRHLDAANAERRQVASAYLDLLRADGVRLPVAPPPDEARPSWHIFTLRSDRRDHLRARLGQDGIGTQVYYPVPPHRTAAYREFAALDLPVATDLARTSLALPCRPGVLPHVPAVAASLRNAMEVE